MFANISIWQLLIILLIVILLFGTKRLKNIGADLGSAIKGFKSSVSEESKSDTNQVEQKDADFNDSKVKEKNKADQ